MAIPGTMRQALGHQQSALGTTQGLIQPC
jgi:hypothetical protein